MTVWPSLVHRLVSDWKSVNLQDHCHQSNPKLEHAAGGAAHKHRKCMRQGREGRHGAGPDNSAFLRFLPSGIDCNCVWSLGNKGRTKSDVNRIKEHNEWLTIDLAPRRQALLSSGCRPVDQPFFSMNPSHRRHVENNCASGPPKHQRQLFWTSPQKNEPMKSHINRERNKTSD